MVRALTFFVLAWAGVAGSGCGVVSSSLSSRSHGRAGPLSISSDGGASPARATRQVERSSVTLPAGSVLEFLELLERPAGEVAKTPGGRQILATLAAPAAFVREATRDTLETATAPRVPGPVDLARAAGVRSYWIAGLGLLALAALFLARRHWLAAGAAGLAGVALPAFATLLAGVWGIVVAVLLVGAAVAFVVGWHVLRSRGALAPGVS